MNNLSSYCGLVDAKKRASDKDLPVMEVFFWNYLTGLEVPELTRDRSHHWPLLDRNYPSPNWHLPSPQSNFLVLHCTLLPNTAGLVKILLLAPRVFQIITR